VLGKKGVGRNLDIEKKRRKRGSPLLIILSQTEGRGRTYGRKGGEKREIFNEYIKGRGEKKKTEKRIGSQTSRGGRGWSKKNLCRE